MVVVEVVVVVSAVVRLAFLIVIGLPYLSALLVAVVVMLVVVVGLRPCLVQSHLLLCSKHTRHKARRVVRSILLRSHLGL